MDANAECISQSCQEILGARFHRISPVLSEEIPLHSTDDYAKLEQIGQDVNLGATFHWIEMQLLNQGEE